MPSKKVFAEFIGETGQNPATPTTSEIIETQPVSTRAAFAQSSDSFLVSESGIFAPTPETENEDLEDIKPVAVKFPFPETKKPESYDKQKCEEIPEGWTCTAFYVGGNKKQELSSQEHAEGDSEKGSSWKSQSVKEWDPQGNLIKNETVRVLEEWNNDAEKGYHYTQRYRNGILEYENYQSLYQEADHQRQGIILESGKLGDLL